MVFTYCFVGSDEKEVKRMLGNLIGEFKGKTTGYRVLPDGKSELSQQGAGKILGIEASIATTGVITPMPNGVLMAEANGLTTTMDGDVVMVKIDGMGWSTGKGWKSSMRGASYQMTQSQKLARLNKVVIVWELDSDENGDWTLQLWEWT
jgi:hypothetical protein